MAAVRKSLFSDPQWADLLLLQHQHYSVFWSPFYDHPLIESITVPFCRTFSGLQIFDQGNEMKNMFTLLGGVGAN